MKDTDYFDKAFDKLIANEGGYANIQADTGGETMWGITKRVAVQNGWNGDMRGMPIDFAKQIYLKDYWKKYNCDTFSSYPLAMNYFDACVDSGGNAAKILQRSVGVEDDGIIGKITISAVEAMDEKDLVMAFNAQRLKFYTKLNNFSTFGAGWANRVANNLIASAS